MNLLKRWLTIATLLMAFFVVSSRLPAKNFDLGGLAYYTRFLLPQAKNIDFFSPYTVDLNAQQDEVVSKASPAVVSVFGYSDGEEEGGSSFFGLLPRASIKRSSSVVKMTAGTGFFVDDEGYILTNKHVVADETADYSVVLENGEKKPAEVVYRDPKYDLAVIKITGSDFPVLPLGDSSKLKVGQAVLGLGNAFGQFPNTVSEGYVSSLRRTILINDESNEQVSGRVIQTNAQLYPGDSGGPLFNLDGEVVGINMAIAANRPNVSFSIPINDAKAIIQSVTGQE